MRRRAAHQPNSRGSSILKLLTGQVTEYLYTKRPSHQVPPLHGKLMSSSILAFGDYVYTALLNIDTAFTAIMEIFKNM